MQHGRRAIEVAGDNGAFGRREAGADVCHAVDHLRYGCVGGRFSLRGRDDLEAAAVGWMRATLDVPCPFEPIDERGRGGGGHPEAVSDVGRPEWPLGKEVFECQQIAGREAQDAGRGRGEAPERP